MAKLVLTRNNHDYYCNDLKGHNDHDHVYAGYDDADHNSIKNCETHDRLYYLSQIALCWASTYPSLRPTPTGVLTNSYYKKFSGIICCY